MNRSLTSRFGFAASAWQRLALALVVAGLGFGLVAAVEAWPDRAAPIRESPRPEPLRAQVLDLIAEASVPVTAWRIRIAGVDQKLDRSDDYSCVLRGPFPAGSELLVEADAADLLSATPVLRLRLVRPQATSERIFWGTLTASMVAP